MNFIKSYNMIPLLLGLSTNISMARTDLLFSESTIINTNYMSFVRSSYISEYQLKITSLQLVQFKFSELYKKWYANTMFYSNPKMIIEDENFQGIISLGEQAIPSILIKIEEEPSQLVWALNIITKRKISKNSVLTISEACKSWVKFGKQSNI